MKTRDLLIILFCLGTILFNPVDLIFMFIVFLLIYIWWWMRDSANKKEEDW